MLQQFPRSILTPLPRTRDLSTILVWALKPITCHIPARMPTILACQSRPSLRAPCLTILHPLPHPRQTRSHRMIQPHPQRATTCQTFRRRRSLGSSLADTSPPVATVHLVSSPILRARIIRVPYPHLCSIPRPMSNHLILPTFTPCLHRPPSFNHRMAYLLPTIFLPSPHSQRRSPYHRHLRSSYTSATPRRLYPLCRSPSTLQEHPCQRQDLTAPCLLSLPHTLILTIFLSLSLSCLRPQRTPLPQGRSRLLRLTRNRRLPLSRTSGSPYRLNKMAHKSRLRKRDSVHVAIVAQVGAQVFAARLLAAVASHHACSSHLAAVEMGMYLGFLLFARALNTLQG